MRSQEEARNGSGAARLKKRAVFLVLHYLAEPTTRKCVKTLLAGFPPEKCDTAVVIADNASPDGSGARLAAEFGDRESVHVLQLPKNFGYAEGNNEACRFARECYDADFIVALNNDVLIRDPAFLERTEEIFLRTGFAVLGPDVRNPGTGSHESPIHTDLLTEEYVRRRRRKFQRENQRFFLYYYAERPIRKAAARMRWGVGPGRPWQEPLEGAVLQGSCLVFSRMFFAKRQNLFRSGTFLYFEEDILALECARAGLKTVYTPELYVEHLRDRSVAADLPSKYMREKRKHRELERSMGVFLEVCAEETGSAGGGAQ